MAYCKQGSGPPPSAENAKKKIVDMKAGMSTLAEFDDITPVALDVGGDDEGNENDEISVLHED
jgi:hypothetical protein